MDAVLLKKALRKEHIIADFHGEAGRNYQLKPVGEIDQQVIDTAVVIARRKHDEMGMSEELESKLSIGLVRIILELSKALRKQDADGQYSIQFLDYASLRKEFPDIKDDNGVVTHEGFNDILQIYGTYQTAFAMTDEAKKS